MSGTAPVKSVLIANRGEIACRIIESCKRLGVQSIAVYSDADAEAQHVQRADVAIHLGGAPAAESYLDIDKLIAAAKRTGAQAVHPGYGFLSESAEFAKRLRDNDILFVGPSVSAINKMGSKADAKQAMEQAGVPTVPGYHGADQKEETLGDEAGRIGFPLLIKAAAGGGGKGMRIVRSANEFLEALTSARREAASSFGDDRVILERYLEQPRHIEVQVFGDTHGNIVHLFERDCSTQRRYQKVLEETPSPFLNDDQRQAMYKAAVDAAAAVNYVGAGTVEFIVDQSGAFFFMEMNTRLQVEHPVTELVTGVDLVEWQLRVAVGEEIPLAQSELNSSGHAIEARLYAEDPNRGFLPGSGRLQILRFPPQGDGIRIDSGVVEGDEVTVHYDPMIAKIIVHADDRDQAIQKLRDALRQTLVIGPADNAGFLEQLLVDGRFGRAEIHTALLDHSLDEFLPTTEPPRRAIAAATCCILLAQEQQQVEDQLGCADPNSPWAIGDGWRVAHQGRRVLHLDHGEQSLDIDAWGSDGEYRLRFPGFDGAWSARLVDDVLMLKREGKKTALTVVHANDEVLVHDGTHRYPFAVSNPLRFHTIRCGRWRFGNRTDAGQHHFGGSNGRKFGERRRCAGRHGSDENGTHVACTARWRRGRSARQGQCVC